MSLIESAKVHAEEGQFGKANIILDKGTTTCYNYLPRSRRCLKEEYATLQDGSMILYVFGEIRYQDVFGIERFTKFKLWLPPEGISVGAFSNCAHGNGAT